MSAATRAPIHHDVKCWPIPFALVVAGKKTFEIRENDRDYQEGDTISLYEYSMTSLDRYTGRAAGPFIVGTVIPGGMWGLPANVCVFSLLRPAPMVEQGAPETDAFEEWAKSEGYDMTEHPLHYLFLNERTYAARQGWKAALRIRAQATATEGEP